MHLHHGKPTPQVGKNTLNFTTMLDYLDFLGYLGFSEIITIVISFAVLFGIFSFIKKRGIVHLSLTKFILNPDDEDQIVIEGRKTGLIQWFLTLLKLGNIYKIHIKKDLINYSAESAAGRTLHLTPIKKIASTSCGYNKPIGLLILAVISIFAGLITLVSGEIAAFILCLLVAGICFAAYVYLKNFFISIETIGSSQLGFSFKRSFIENIPINIEKIEEVISHINKLVLESDQK